MTMKEENTSQVIQSFVGSESFEIGLDHRDMGRCRTRES